MNDADNDMGIIAVAAELKKLSRTEALKQAMILVQEFGESKFCVPFTPKTPDTSLLAGMMLWTEYS